jgi:transposase
VLFRHSIANLADTLTDLETRIDKLNKQIESWTKQDNTAKALLTLCGVGSVTTSAAVAMAGDVSVFKKRQAICRVAQFGTKAKFIRR